MTNAFELTATERLNVLKVTPRKEQHGDEHVQAISLRLGWTTSNDALDRLHPNLRDMLFYDPPEVIAQLNLDGMPPVKKHRRCPDVDMPLKLNREHAGYTLTIDHGMDDSSALELYGCSLTKFAVSTHEGGSVTIAWSVGSNKSITPELVGELCALEGDEVTARLVAPKSGDGEVIDGTGAEFAKDHPEAGDLFSQQHGSHDSDGPRNSDDDAGGADSEGGETDITANDAQFPEPDPVAAEAAEFEAGLQRELDAAGVQPKGRRGLRVRTAAVE